MKGGVEIILDIYYKYEDSNENCFIIPGFNRRILIYTLSKRKIDNRCQTLDETSLETFTRRFRSQYTKPFPVR